MNKTSKSRINNYQASDKTNEKPIKKILIQLMLIILASLLYAGSFPNPVFAKGLPFLAWFAFVPFIIVIKKTTLPVSAGWGIIYGCLSYALFNYWLANFHPMAGLFVYLPVSVYMAVIFLLFKFADKLYPNRGYIIQWVIWIAYEFLRTKGFLGYPYGLIGYSQWEFIPLLQIASITGVWGVSALVAFPSFWIADFLNKGRGTRDKGQEINASNHIENKKEILLNKTSCPLSPVPCKFFNKEKIPVIIWALALIISLIYGFARDKDFTDYPKANIALIQHNTDPWAASRSNTAWQKHELYQKDLNILMRLSSQALASEPKPDLVVWPETAFIPRIHWHTVNRQDQDIWLIIRELLSYLEKQDVPFLIGNDHGQSDISGNPVSYNAALLFEKGENTSIYSKMHLVPFTEHFPYQKQLPFLYNALLKADIHLWEKGKEKTVFTLPGFSFSSPICFEDTFGYISRDFTNLGADILVNLSNDAWAKSLSSQYQHLSMAVFRAAENSRSMVRSTVSGQTCAIDPAGRIINEAPAFTDVYLNVSVPISGKTTLYTKYGDYLGFFFVFTAVFLLIYKIIWGIIKR